MPTLIQVVAATGQTVYVFIFNATGQVWNALTLAFETYNVSNWASYAIAAAEKTGSGNYFATIPAGITTAATYSWTGYIQLAGAPASGDTPIDRGNFVIYPTGGSVPIPTGLAALITSLRTLAEDGADQKVIFSEQLGASDQPAFPVNGSNKVFRLRSVPLSDNAGSPIYSWVTIIGNGGTVRSQSIFTVVDPIAGIIQFTNAPDPGNGTYPVTPPVGVYLDYYYQWFTDAKYAEFLVRAANMTLASTTDPTTIPEGLKEAMLQYGLGQAMASLASRFAMEYQSSGGDASNAPQTKSAQFRSLANDATKRGDKLKSDFYQRQGQRDAPAWGDIDHRWDLISPRR